MPNNYNPQVVSDLIRKVGLRINSEHLESLGFTLKFTPDWTSAVYQHEDGTKVNYVLGYLQDVVTPDFDVEVCVQTNICGQIESVRFGDYFHGDFEYPLTEGERWAR